MYRAAIEKEMALGSRLSGKTAFVTAAGQGIGRATALAFAREGARVVASDIDRDALASLEKQAGCATRVLDVTDAKAIADTARAVGDIDVLCNAAGYVHAGTILDCSEDDWSFAFEINVRSQFRTIRAFLPGMLAKGRGSIVNIASVVGSLKGAPNRFAYGATKAAVIGLTKSVAADYVTRVALHRDEIRAETNKLDWLFSTHTTSRSAAELLLFLHSGMMVSKGAVRSATVKAGRSA